MRFVFKNLGCLALMCCIMSVCSCSKTNQQKKEFIKQNLNKTNKTVIEGRLFKKKHGDLIVPDFVKAGDFNLDEIE